MSTAQKIHRTRLESFLHSTHGRFITVTFVKVDGSVRVLTGRFGVRRGLKGGVNKATTHDKPYITIWDARKSAYRSINLLTVLTIHAQRVHYEVID